MECIHCHGTMQRSRARCHIDRKDYRLAIKAVPAWICGQCGEPFFEEREVDAIQGVIRTLDEQTRLLGEDAGPPRSQRKGDNVS